MIITTGQILSKFECEKILLLYMKRKYLDFANNIIIRFISVYEIFLGRHCYSQDTAQRPSTATNYRTTGFYAQEIILDWIFCILINDETFTLGGWYYFPVATKLWLSSDVA